VDGKRLDVYKEVAAILKDSDFRPRLEILRVASKCIGKHARWMMGCDCHEAALEGMKDHSKRRAKLISVGVVDGVCPWASRRGVALACGRVDILVDDIANFARRLDVRFLPSSSHQRALVISQADTLAQRIRDPVDLKLKAMFQERRGSLLGCLGAYFGHCTQSEVSKRIVGLCQEYDRLSEPGGAHRVASYYLAKMAAQECSA
jgi:hypothetical protein